MDTSNKATFTFSKDKKSVEISRHFDAPLPLVWKAWTEAAILDKWWAPKPWKSETRKMLFANEGQRLYCMCGPAGERSWGLITFHDIKPQVGFAITDAFCDESGRVNNDFPSTHWEIRLEEKEGTNLVNVLTSSKEEDMKKLIDMGFQEGYAMALDNLEEWLRGQKT